MSGLFWGFRTLSGTLNHLTLMLFSQFMMLSILISMKTRLFPGELYDRKVSSRITKYVATNWPRSIPVELHDINVTSSNYWRKYLDRVSVPTMHGSAELQAYFLKLLEDYTRCFGWFVAEFPLLFRRRKMKWRLLKVRMLLPSCQRNNKLVMRSKDIGRLLSCYRHVNTIFCLCPRFLPSITTEHKWFWEVESM